jgi:tetratricopeptide (TPR) repeat protein
MSDSSTVRVRIEDRVFPTYLPAWPDRNPMFLEKRVYQGSSGKVYPLPFTDRISEQPVNRKWKAIWIENEFLRAMVLPELGGRIHVLQDKTNGYDLIYNQPVIKPALVGLAGPWISGGIEFNWPQHHRPATFLPADYEIENHADGSKTIWCSDHDPMTRMKGMHGVCLHLGCAYLELKVRAYNRTPHVQTFLWWANVATRVHEAYQSFFPPDVYYVADHARRSMSEYPVANGFYYGVNYGERGRKGVPRNDIPRQFVPAHCRSKSGDSKLTSQVSDYAANDLSFYSNIPTPCSYMCMGSQEDFFGGYDYKAQAGIVHIANHHISPGKKQWTWGNHEFGYAWDRHLTDADKNGEYAPYIEIMAGVYTDNQPDFSFLQPGETKTWSQYWYPIQKIGPAQHANLLAAVSLRFVKNGARRRNVVPIGVAVTRKLRAKILLTANARKLFSTVHELTPAKPLVKEIKLPGSIIEKNLLLQVFDSGGNEIISYQPQARNTGKVPPPATEPPLPEDIASNDELFIAGLHLQQYRHATRCPTLYWREALRRDPLDARCNNAMGLWHLDRGEFNEAEKYFLQAIERLTRRNANPYDGEAYYNLGMCLRFQSRSLPDGKSEVSDLKFSRAYDAFYKATWNQAWAAAGYHALAEMDCCRQDWTTALEHLNRSLRFNQENLRARNLKVLVLRKLAAAKRAPAERKNLEAAADALLGENLAFDPLDWWARSLRGEVLKCDLQTALDLARDFARAGFYLEGIRVLTKSFEFYDSAAKESTSRKTALPNRSLGARPLAAYAIGWLRQKEGNGAAAKYNFRSASKISSEYCFPSRLEDIAVLEAAIHANPRDAKAPYYLGNLLYDRRRHIDAIKLWEKSARLDASFSIVWRNLGIGYFNILKNPGKARAAYGRAFRSNLSDARVLYERDQLCKRLGTKPEKRLAELKKYPHLVSQRDDLSVEFCALLNQTDCHIEAMQFLARRKFQPWEGGEGAALGQHVRTQLAFGREALFHHDYPCAVSHFENALKSPLNLGEAKHLLANQSDIHYWLGVALELFRDKKSALEHWKIAANFKGNFQSMSVRTFSEMTYYSALSLQKLGQQAKARKLLSQLLAYAKKLQKTEAKIDYFATSLPSMLLFEDDLQFRQETTALFLQTQAQLGMGKKSEAKNLLSTVLKRDPNHAMAADLWSEHFQPVKP